MRKLNPSITNQATPRKPKPVGTRCSSCDLRQRGAVVHVGGDNLGAQRAQVIGAAGGARQAAQGVPLGGQPPCQV